MSFIGAILAKAVAGVTYLFVLPGLRACHDDTEQVPSRDPGRTIKVHIYRSSTPSKSSPVLINFHGSGFLIPLHGSDGDWCRKVSRKTNYTVLDVQYRLTPDHPYPAAPDDAEDVVLWVQQQQREGLQFGDGRIALSGFSAGGNLALGAAPRFPRETFHAILAFYPWLDLDKNPWLKIAPNPLSVPLPAFLLDLCRIVYVPANVSRKDPRISPVFAPVDNFPDRVLVVTASCDTLAWEGEKMVKRINQDPNRRRSAESQRMGWFCGHGWDKYSLWGTLWWWAKEKAYGRAIAMLSN
ncbi:hypothetical protein NUU61_001788 [Penicillium alfredii]|uniref:Alpha/beta hydrolase fold-3 domain-containing protein n=1 Tax=Penicillium alfredii TaxID=1506179 RepID=A0A9W9FQD3_9EURO|nr:uncharacterized protein NUU61_001788 [Penicillium alfredii]KAJ5104441.1 hypothetical protein NUU61_001788 [Penicillium alfredii]